LDAVPLEVSIREEIGAVVSTDALASVPEQVQRLCGEGRKSVEGIRAARERWVFNVGESGQRGAQAIAGILESIRA
jgi:YidC/Oxa1 family membrane protein insertase